MNSLRQKLALLLCAATVLTGLTSCADNPDSEKEDESAPTAEELTPEIGEEPVEEPEEIVAMSTLPDADFEGRTVRLLTSNADGRQADIISEELNGNTLNDAVFNRNVQMEERFGVVMDCVDNGGSGIAGVIKTNVIAGEVPYDFYFGNALADMVSNMSQNYLYQLDTLPVVNLSNPWWDQGSVSNLSIGGKAYMVTGDISPTSLLTSEALLFNKNLFTNYGVEFPYGSVFEGTWTLDRFNDLRGGMGSDLNGDGKITTADDLYAYTGWHYDCCDALFYGAGGYYTVKDGNDFPTLAFEMERLSAIFDKLAPLATSEYSFIAEGSSENEHKVPFGMFAEGRSFFCGIQFWKVDRYLREMEDDFGVLPEPKYDESQPQYLTSVQDHCPMIVVQSNVVDTDVTGTLMEAMAAYAFDNISTQIYDIIAGTKNVRDEESSRIVDMVIRNRRFDIGMLVFDDLSRIVITQNKCDNIASYFEKMNKVSAKTLEKYIKAASN